MLSLESCEILSSWSELEGIGMPRCGGDRIVRVVRALAIVRWCPGVDRIISSVVHEGGASVERLGRGCGGRSLPVVSHPAHPAKVSTCTSACQYFVE